MRLTLLALALAATPAFAETPLTAEEFEAHVTGKTVTYFLSGTVFGTEEYLSGRHVRWSTEDGTCSVGSWYPRDGNICFAYAGSGDISCWTYLRTGTGIEARSLDDYPQRPYETQVSAVPLTCTDPTGGN